MSIPIEPGSFSYVIDYLNPEEQTVIDFTQPAGCVPVDIARAWLTAARPPLPDERPPMNRAQRRAARKKR